MFKIKDTRLIAHGISIPILNEFYLSNCKFESGIIFTDESHSFAIKIVINDFPIITENQIRKQIASSESDIKKEVSKITINGLSGFSYVCNTLDVEYYELKLQNESKYYAGHISIVIITNKTGPSLKNVLSSPEVIEFFCNVCAD